MQNVMHVSRVRSGFSSWRFRYAVRVIAVMLAIALFLFSSFAEARRFGGGGSFGRLSPGVNQRYSTPPAQRNAQNQRQQPQQVEQPMRKPWGGMLGGLAAGLGFAALFHMLGADPLMGEMLGTLLLVLLVAGVVMFLLHRIRQFAALPTGAGTGADIAHNNAMQFQGAVADLSTTGVPNTTSVGNSWGRLEVPIGFDAKKFETVAKENFIRMQRAWDAGDVNMLRVLMTDDMLSEIKKQLAERRHDFIGRINQTDVVTLDAQLLGVEDLGAEYMASVEFSGMIREDVNEGAQPFCEVWNLIKSKADANGGWLLAGLQQVQR